MNLKKELAAINAVAVRHQAKRIEAFIRLGNIMLKEAGESACQNGYGTIDPEYVGRQALAFGDINSDGTLN